MKLRAWLAAGLVTTAAAATAQAAPQMAAESLVQSAIAASYGSSSVSGGRAPVVRWDGQAVEQDDMVRGLRESSRDAIETWRRFAERRGYRVDLDETQRVLIVSDAERFESFASSERIIAKVLDRVGAFEGISESGPIVLVRARDAGDAEDAMIGASKLDVAQRLSVFPETGTLRDVRAVNARLAEALVTAHLDEHQPFLSNWMVDGLASLIAEETTGRAIVDGETTTLRSVRSAAAKTHRRDIREAIDFGSLTVPGKGVMEADAMAVISYLDESTLLSIVPELGQREATGGLAKSNDEEEAVLSHLGKNALRDLQKSLLRGK